MARSRDVIVAGSGPTGMMLAGELALAGVDVVDRGAATDVGAGGVARGRVPLAHDRDPRPARDRRPVPGGGADRADGEIRHHGAGHQRLSDAASVRARVCGRTAWSRSSAAGSRSSACRSIAGERWSASSRTRPASTSQFADGETDAGEVPRRRRWRAQRDPQGRGHRLPRLGRDAQQPDRRGRGHRRAAARHASGRDGGPRSAPDGGRAHLPGGHDRAAARSGRRAHPGRPQRAPSERSTAPTSECTARPGSPGSPTPPGRPRPTAAGASCSPGMPRTSTIPPADRASVSASRTPSTWGGSSPRS